MAAKKKTGAKGEQLEHCKYSGAYPHSRHIR
jgi:hypothetical protein